MISERKREPRRWKTESGLALPATIWFTLALFLLLASVLNFTLDQKRSVSSSYHQTQMSLAADAAIAVKIKELLDAKSRWRELLAENPSRVSFGDVEVDVVLSSEEGRLNLNQAGPKLLAAYFEEAGLATSVALTLATDVLRYRESKPFRAVEDLLLVDGVSRELLKSIRADLTVYSNGPGVWGEFASLRLQHALARLGGEGTSATSVIKPEEFQSGTVWRLSARVVGLTGSETRIEQVVRLTGRGERPYLVHYRARIF